MEREVKFNKGDLVRFVPRHRKYTPQEMYHKGGVGEVTDFSDLPNVKMIGDTYGAWKYKEREIITADQRDLKQIGCAI